VRCVAIPQKGLFSRLRKEFPHLEHIKEEINRLPMILDGELYSNEIGFQEIVGIVKRETLKPGDPEKQLKIQYHVYDMISQKPYEERLKDLQDLFRSHCFQHIVLVDTTICHSEAEMKQQHAQYVSDGYEGIMLRSPQGLYKHSRSVDLLKYKEFFDDEYEVIGFREGDGLERGCVIWTCRTAEGNIFHCRPRGTHEERAEWFKHGPNYIGEKLTVRYQEKTDDGLPRFPVGIAFRNYE
jgi:ATP-dependent DNA ligase